MRSGDAAFGDEALVQMRWRDALFAHWETDPETVAGRLPPGVEVATYDGHAWIGVVAFVMEDIRPCGVPFGLSFPELNLRTYVTRSVDDAERSEDDTERSGDGAEVSSTGHRTQSGDSARAVYFFNLDADDRLGVALARLLYSLPYYRADMRVRSGADESIEFASQRTHWNAPPAHFDATYEPVGDDFTPEPGTLEHFFVENYRFYTVGRRLYYGDISHPPWPLYEANAEIRSNTLFSANGFETPTDEPVIHYSPGIEVTAGRIHRA
ncbi:YqjF family protein [Halogeometricum borinquense]|uniref:YqjF family protein n=1 Tax=Halogeometricum borinquense TaxID=60847 RepID=UPI00343643C2